MVKLLISLFLRIQIGTVDIVALNDFKSVKEGFTNPALQSRLNHLFLDQTGWPGEELTPP